jgi:TetR/AcrR family transcriptional regulator, transcriptional repressor for nem operon
MASSKKSEQTRADLIQVGIEQLSVIGYHGTGVKQVLDVLKVPKGSFYNYFESKEGFVAEVISEFGRELMQDLDEFMDNSHLGAVDQLRAMLDDSIERYESLGCRRGCLIGSLAAELGSQSKLCQQALRQVAVQWEQRIADILAIGQKQGEIRTDLRPSQLASIFWSCWEGALLRMKLEGQSEPLRQMAPLILDSVLQSSKATAE